jgi:hypothetical protein
VLLWGERATPGTSNLARSQGGEIPSTGPERRQRQPLALGPRSVSLKLWRHPEGRRAPTGPQTRHPRTRTRHAAARTTDRARRAGTALRFEGRRGATGSEGRKRMGLAEAKALRGRGQRPSGTRPYAGLRRCGQLVGNRAIADLLLEAVENPLELGRADTA